MGPTVIIGDIDARVFQTGSDSLVEKWILWESASLVLSYPLLFLSDCIEQNIPVPLFPIPLLRMSLSISYITCLSFFFLFLALVMRKAIFIFLRKAACNVYMFLHSHFESCLALRCVLWTANFSIYISESMRTVLVLCCLMFVDFNEIFFFLLEKALSLFFSLHAYLSPWYIFELSH